MGPLDYHSAMPMNTNSWLVCAPASRPAQARLFCLPYAGGDALIYRSWSGDLSSDLEVCAFQFPGRGKRISEPRFTRMDALVPALVEAMRGRLDLPFMIFGHSLGALIAFELARALRRMALPQPKRLFLSARRAPQLPSRIAEIHRLPESEFREELYRGGGVPREVLDHEELMALMSPMLRADYEIVETYRFSPEAPLDVPFTIFGGIADEDVDRPALEAWQEQTSAAVRIEMLPGDHFFLNSQRKSLLQTIDGAWLQVSGLRRSG